MTYHLLLITVSILFAFITWRNIRHGIFLIAAFLPAYLLRFEIGNVPMTMLEVMILIVVVICIVRHCEAKGRSNLLDRKDCFTPFAMTPSTKKIIFPILFLLGAATISIFVAPDRLAALGIWKAYFVEPILLFAVMTKTLSRDDLPKLFLALGGGALFVSLFAIFQFVTGLAIPIPWDVEKRVTSIFEYPNAVGLYLGPIVVLGVFGLYHSVIARTNEVRTKQSIEKIASVVALPRNDKRVWFWIATVVLSCAAIVLAQNEAAIAAVCVTIFLSSLFVKKIRRITIPLATLVVIAVVTIPMLRAPVFQKLSLQDYSGQTRITQWQETLPMLLDHPIFGAGLNGYPAALTPYHTHDHIEIFQYPHNIILNIWSELGLLGLVAFVWLAVILSLRGAPSDGATKQSIDQNEKIASVTAFPRNDNTLLCFASLAALLVMCIHGLVDVPYFKNDLAVMTWILIAVIVVVSSPVDPQKKT